MTPKPMAEKKIITVCKECLTAACWHGEFYCDKYKEAGTTNMTVAELRKLELESPDYWSDKQQREVCGHAAPNGYAL